MEKIDFQEEIKDLASIIFQQGHALSYFGSGDKRNLTSATKLKPKKTVPIVVKNSDFSNPMMMSSYFESFSPSSEIATIDCVELATAVSFWLISNKEDIETLADFRSKLDKFTSVLSHPLYLDMEGNLCVSAAINGYLGNRKSEAECSEVLQLMGYRTDLGEEELDAISRDRYNRASVAFEELKENEEVRSAAQACKFAMNFKFTGDYSEAESLYNSVSIFSDVSDRLEQIYTNKENSSENKMTK